MGMQDVQQFVFPRIGSNMFLWTAGTDALVIDPHVSEDALQSLLREQVQRVKILLTHEHYDHTSGLLWLCERFPCQVICHEETARSLRDGKNNRPALFATGFMGRQMDPEDRAFLAALPKNYRYDPQITFSDEYAFSWCGTQIRMVHIPGHSPGSCCIELGSEAVATGDTLIYDIPVITRFPGGSNEIYDRCAIPYLNRLADGMLILPGHGKMFLFGERSPLNRKVLQDGAGG